MNKGPYLLFVVEAKSDNKSDWIYIESVIHCHYEPRKHRHRAIYAGGKSKLTSIGRINAAKKGASGKIHVIVCADKDRNDDHLNDEIIKFCKDNGFDLVWMNLNIEDVFLGEPNVRTQDKQAKAVKFAAKRDKKLEELGTDRLMVDDPLKKSGSSNLMLVLDRYIKRIK